MGNCCCGESSTKEPSGYSQFNGAGAGAGAGGPRAPETEKDREARLLAAEKAAQRQQNFEKSAVGRAAYTAVKEAKKPINQNSGDGPVSARDWQN